KRLSVGILPIPKTTHRTLELLKWRLMNQDVNLIYLRTISNLVTPLKKCKIYTTNSLLREELITRTKLVVNHLLQSKFSTGCNRKLFQKCGSLINRESRYVRQPTDQILTLSSSTKRPYQQLTKWPEFSKPWL